MNRKVLKLALASLFMTAAGAAVACDYTSGETKYIDYANCRYGEDSIQVVHLPEGATWEECVYYLEAFRPEKLLAVTKVQDGKELASINNRSQIGNPCYLTKQRCDEALRAQSQ